MNKKMNTGGVVPDEFSIMILVLHPPNDDKSLLIRGIFKTDFKPSSFLRVSLPSGQSYGLIKDIRDGTQHLPEIKSENIVIVLRDISKEQAKQEVQKLLITSPKPLDHGEIADELRLDLKLVAQVCTELIREGVIEFA